MHFQLLAALLPLVTMTGALPNAEKRLIVNADVLSGGDNNGNVYYDSNNREHKVVNNYNSHNTVDGSYNQHNGNGNTVVKSGNHNANGSGNKYIHKNQWGRPCYDKRLVVNADVLSGGDNNNNVFYDSNNVEDKVINNVNSHNKVIDSYNQHNGNGNTVVKSGNHNGNGSGNKHIHKNFYGRPCYDKRGMPDGDIAETFLEEASEALQGGSSQNGKRLLIKADVLSAGDHNGNTQNGGASFGSFFKRGGLLDLDVLSAGDHNGNSYSKSFNGAGSDDKSLIDVDLLSGGDHNGNSYSKSFNSGGAGHSFDDATYKSHDSYHTTKTNVNSKNTVVDSFNQHNGNGNVIIKSGNHNFNGNGNTQKSVNQYWTATPQYRPPAIYDPSRNQPSFYDGNSQGRNGGGWGWSSGWGKGWGWGRGNNKGNNQYDGDRWGNSWGNGWGNRWGNGWGNSQGHGYGHGRGGDVRANWYQYADVDGWRNTTGRLVEGAQGHIDRLGGGFRANSAVSWNATAVEVGYSTRVGDSTLGGGYTVTPWGATVGAGLTHKGKRISFQLHVNDDGEVYTTVSGRDLYCSGRGSESHCTSKWRR
ncbi:hypothetical protein OC844_001160 [Tilletia horrida]|nr:hypothetical protein OC844_001160 [Tilletia horrida]